MSQSTPRAPQPRLPAAAACALLAVLAGCTSDVANPVGAGLPGELQLNTPQTLFVGAMSVSGQVAVKDESRSYDHNELLYFGVQGSEASSILARYDVTTLPDSLPAGSVLNETTVTSVKLRLFRTEAYAAVPDSLLDEVHPLLPQNPQKVFETYTLAAPLDAALYPGPEPATEAQIGSQTGSGASVFLDLPVAQFLSWVTAGMNGLLIREGSGSQPGLVGYAAVDMTSSGYQEIDRVGAGTTVGPVLTVAYRDAAAELDTAFVFEPVADVSTFHALAAPPSGLAAGFEVQTHLRRYPYFFPDLDGLPDDILINRAVLRLAIDANSFGPVESLVLHEVPLSLLADRDTVTVQEIEAVAVTSAGILAVDLGQMIFDEETWVGFDVTGTMQRALNGALAPDTVLLLTAGEDFGGYRVSGNYTPDFYFGRMLFLGTAHPAQPPHFEITFTPFSGGGL
ncbi:MAG: hypothetical protein Q7W56_12970 [Candidatus Latescibacteria bacterium]|nr:hypothetical protein [Candidatus Latescibacterota bacterium]